MKRLVHLQDSNAYKNFICLQATFNSQTQCLGYKRNIYGSNGMHHNWCDSFGPPNALNDPPSKRQS